MYFSLLGIQNSCGKLLDSTGGRLPERGRKTRKTGKLRVNNPNKSHPAFTGSTVGRRPLSYLSPIPEQRINATTASSSSPTLPFPRQGTIKPSGPGCSKLTTSLVNETLNFQMLISQISQYFLLKKCEKLLHCKSFSHFFNKKYQCVWLQSHKTLNELTS